MMKKVVTLDDNAFADACRKLRETVDDFGPDLVVGIPTGGSHVAASAFTGMPTVEISLHRPSTARKKRGGWPQRLMRNLPYPLLNAMRVVESYMLQSRHNLTQQTIDPQTIESATVSAIRRASRILIVDDAIDSGATIQTVRNLVRQLSPEATVRTAVITVTTPAPLLQPDYTLFNNNTLIRFPWSMDYKK